MNIVLCKLVTGEEVLGELLDGRFGKRRATVARAGEYLEPDLNAFFLQRGVELLALRERHERVVRAVQDELPAGTERLLSILENSIKEAPAT